MKKFVSTILAAAFSVQACGAFAQSISEHIVYIERSGYFPTNIHINRGDRIKFINRSGNWARVFSENHNDNYSGYDTDEPCEKDSDGNYYFAGPKDGWSTGWISDDSQLIVTIHECSETDLRSPRVDQYGWNIDTYRGTIRFDPPDLGK